jgi:hypothetical protein
MARVTRALSTRDMYSIKHSSFDLEGVWLDAMGSPETFGAWLIWGAEKNGKTWVTLMLSDMLSHLKKVLYISGEEGTGSAFVDALKRAKISPTNSRLKFRPYEPLPDLYKRLKMRDAAKIVILDNITVYNQELKNGALYKLLQDFPDVLFIFLAHEERGEPYTATAKLVKKLAKIIVHVQGLACIVGGRCKGGRLIIDEERALLYHGHEALNKSN